MNAPDICIMMIVLPTSGLPSESTAVPVTRARRVGESAKLMSLSGLADADRDALRVGDARAVRVIRRRVAGSIVGLPRRN